MRSSMRMAYGGVLTAVSVTLLLVASLSAATGWGCCICAGMVPAVPLAKRQVRVGLLIYVATLLLSVLLVPVKRYVLAYMLFFGFYPLVKYGIERLHRLVFEWAAKLGFAAILGAVLWQFVRSGLLILGTRAAALPPLVLFAAYFAAFIFYDIIFSKIIALFRVLFRA